MSTILKDQITFRPLKIEFIGTGEVRGFNFRQIRSTNSCFLYEVDTGSTKHYEVFKKVINHRFACVSYPRSKSFGVWAWCYKTKSKAEKKFNELIIKNNDEH
ncbi:hypothetical protein [uncultured Winogradskyella sp.]|uniref:hypothetical protein n=1 Tax=uncultured Winogradskyella sp. TaxID=395353 RepID=UPI003513F1C4